MEEVNDSYGLVLLSMSPSGDEFCCAELSNGTFRLKAAADLEIPPEAFVGKHVGIKGVILEAGPDLNDWDAYHMRHETGLIEVQEWYNCSQYPKEQLLADAERIKQPVKRSNFEYVSTDEVGIFCPQCQGSLGTNIPRDQIDHFKGQLCKSCERLPPSTRTGLNFTQEQLIAAYQQMEYERRQDGEKAQRMFEWVCNQTGIGIKNGGPRTNSHGFAGINISPYETPYYFCFVHQTYGPYLDYFTDALKRVPWARHVRGENRGPVYEVDTPEGTYEVVFELFY